MPIGEALGYYGCRLSGIVFTCEENFTADKMFCPYIS